MSAVIPFPPGLKARSRFCRSMVIAANEVDQVSYGDCKGLTNYTKALLDVVGVTSYYTHVEAGRNKISFEADFAFVKAWKGDAAGNLVFKGTSRNFNPNMCGAAKITVAEVEHLVPVGELDPNHIHIPGIFVQRIFEGTNYEKRIEQRTVRSRGE